MDKVVRFSITSFTFCPIMLNPFCWTRLVVFSYFTHTLKSLQATCLNQSAVTSKSVIISQVSHIHIAMDKIVKYIDYSSHKAPCVCAQPTQSHFQYTKKCMAHVPCLQRHKKIVHSSCNALGQRLPWPTFIPIMLNQRTKLFQPFQSNTIFFLVLSVVGS